MRLDILLTTDGYNCIAQFYNTDSIPDGTLTPNSRVVVEGVLLTIDDRTLISGTSQGLIVVMASKTSTFKAKK